MKKVTLWGGLVFVLALGIALFSAVKFGKKSVVYAAGQISISPELETNAEGIRTLFISIYDMDSPMPMPFGAVKERLSADAKGQFFDFFLTKESLRLMNPNAATPQRLRVKARIDVDGMGGAAQPGDLLGEIEGVAVGTQGVSILIDNVK